jgi:hypothetical protein
MGENTPAILKLNHEPLNYIPMDEPVRLADAPAIRKISEDCENRWYESSLPTGKWVEPK